MKTYVQYCTQTVDHNTTQHFKTSLMREGKGSLPPTKSGRSVAIVGIFMVGLDGCNGLFIRWTKKVTLA